MKSINHFVFIDWSVFTLKGEESNLYSGKINNDVAKTIRDMRNNRNMSYGEIADIFDLSRATIINICKNRIYT